ncbi:MAG TPA: hypothetical protein VF678_01965 [bacterium]
MSAAAMGNEGSGNIPRSILAVVGGFVVVFVLSLGTDQILHMLAMYPPWGQPMWDPAQNAMALSYRLVYNTVGCYLIARWAPRRPMKHALIGGVIGLVLSALGGAAAVSQGMGPMWYPAALALSSVPCAYVGAKLYRAR